MIPTSAPDAFLLQAERQTSAIAGRRRSRAIGSFHEPYRIA